MKLVVGCGINLIRKRNIAKGRRASKTNAAQGAVREKTRDTKSATPYSKQHEYRTLNMSRIRLEQN